ncbi:MAG TPA: cytochrome c family protein [Bacteroidota bacterium]|nr:cytochrome c family protein [Bacteroidota bacterium]
MRRFILITLTVGLIFGVSSMLNAQNKYVGVKQCSMCHKTDKQGKQFDIWSKSKHAGAFKTLATPAADEIAAKKGFKTKAAETPECLGCHTVAAAADGKLAEKSFDIKDGVQCEVCHGAGSAYKNMAVMKDEAKSHAAGMTDFNDKATIQKKCETCHNEKSPTAKKFDFAASWAKIEHKVPKAAK